ncbi:hypothetical protein BDB00DRAFT_855748 [Zychaea mexicana]|uniref:uncharacterized protein n=1 Tax=Zychaea mexicana TaxID=64656 RepID=UPI0022FEE1D2|nr:uncharacterized protein BDB00DRAFT_855748 [Zychaea mexicana]KAI9484444.1 hypothetical protein BDB00DRAFT_855748 [Zychaea mexicana]
MSEIVLSNSSNQYVPDYSASSMMSNFNPATMGVHQKDSSPTSSSPSQVTYEDGQQHYYHDYAAFQQMPLNYQAVPITYPATATTTTAVSAASAAAVPRFGYYDQQQQQHHHRHHPRSPESISSSSSPQTPPSSSVAANSNNNNSNANTGAGVPEVAAAPAANYPQVLTSQALEQNSSTQQQQQQTAENSLITPLVPSSTFTNSTTERVKETIARANSVPMEFYHTEFLEYSKETYEKRMDAKRNKRKRPSAAAGSSSSGSSNYNSCTEDLTAKKKKASDTDKEDSDDEADDDEIDKEAEERGLSNAELRRQIHIQSEQKRRAQIKDGFDELRKHLPGCNNKKMSKAALLTRTVQQIQHLKNMQNELLSEVERLVQENETLKKFQHGILQRQALEKMYTF